MIQVLLFSLSVMLGSKWVSSFRAIKRLTSTRQLSSTATRTASFTVPTTPPPVSSIFPTKTDKSGTGYVDVHAHLFHKKIYGNKEGVIAAKVKAAGVEHVIVNGLEPETNRETLEMCKRHAPMYLPAIGIYPLNACANVITDDLWKLPFERPKKFDIDAEIAFIDQMAETKQIVAIGECGLDKHYLTDSITFAEQERVLRLLMRVARKHDLPIILHTRKAERRTFELLLEERVAKADFHCYMGSKSLAKEIAAAGYYMSLPSAIVREDKGAVFRGLAEVIPFEFLLTETDSPYMGPNSKDNNPSTVTQSIAVFATIKGVSEKQAKAQIRENFRRLFGF